MIDNKELPPLRRPLYTHVKPETHERINEIRKPLKLSQGGLIDKLVEDAHAKKSKPKK